MKNSILLPLFLGLVMAGCSRTGTDSQKISSNDKSDASRSAYNDRASTTAPTDAASQSQGAVASTPAPTASADVATVPPVGADVPSEVATMPSSSATMPPIDSMAPSVLAASAAPATPVAESTATAPAQVAAIPTTDATSPADQTASATKPDISARLAEWKLTPADIKSEFESSGQVVRSRTAGAGEPTGPMDSMLITQVTDKLTGDTDTSALNITVSANQGIVSLEGSAASLQQIGKAVALALDTDGVTQAISKIKLDAAPAAAPAPTS
jgi:hypothetical protein